MASHALPNPDCQPERAPAGQAVDCQLAGQNSQPHTARLMQPALPIFTEQDLAEISEKLWSRMVATAWGVLGVHADAEDAVQDALVGMTKWVGKPWPCPPQNKRSYVCSVAHNHAVSLLRSKKRVSETPNRGGTLETEEFISSGKGYRPPMRPAALAEDDDPPNALDHPEVFKEPILALLEEEFKNKPAMLRCLRWSLSADPVTRKQTDLAAEAGVTPAAINMSLRALYEAALRASVNYHKELPGVRLKKKGKSPTITTRARKRSR